MALQRITAEEAAALIGNNDHVGFSGFTHAGCPKAVPFALARRAEEAHAAGRDFKIGVFTGASTGDNIDGALTRARAIKFRTPYQTNADIRAAINNGTVPYFDLHLSSLAQDLRYGFYGPIDVAVIEAADVTESGEIIPTCGVGISPTLVKMARTVIVELNRHHPLELRGMHDLLDLDDPPHRGPIGITSVRSRIGKDYIQASTDRLFVVETDLPNDGGTFAPVDDITTRIGENAARFLASEMRRGTIPPSFLPIQSGVGNIANAVLAAMGADREIPPFEIYTEVIQDAVVDLLESGRVTFASGGTFTVSNPCIERIYANLPYFRPRTVLRTSELSNHPEVIRRLGIISMNTAIEADLFGQVNSTHVAGSRIMNGLGGSGDFTRNAYISIFLTPSVARDGRISALVPMVSHVDHNEHSVKVIITEQGVADLRGKSPAERARTILDNCVHPDYRPLLSDYLRTGTTGHTPLNLYNAFAFHRALIETGDMRNADIK